ncbi:hypothetical protein JOF48_001236 [Arthrobacter stackebrandtii]|uniref:Septum formation-related domain-containing protein n=1 Tax=Arthrobacter stackebrandtii TaxID=272161 RepID=A0ABS4YVK4_9MICC|nr:hypothetical protein [Arthrobacter stackebrandtii]MBP2412437.1 hypothetical protein [Arthrobacter stackebrandtii]PYH02201.1 hypothetical protein CVV67_01835 [Arthrobacter stackebrandtii]
MNESSKANDHGIPEEPAEATVPDPVEPEISTPSLGEAEISEDVAESVDLKSAEAEAAAVEHEAEMAALAVSSDAETFDGGAAATAAAEAAEAAASGTPIEVSESADVAAGPGTDASVPAPAPAPDETRAEAPAGDAQDSGTPAAPATAAGGESAVGPEGEASASIPPTGPVHIGPGIDDGHGWRRPEARWEQSGTPWTPKGDQWQSPSQISRNAADAAEAAAAAGGGVEGPAVPAADTPEPVVYPAGTVPPGSADGRGTAASGPDADGAPVVETNSRKLLTVAAIVIVGLGLLIAFIMLLVGLFNGGDNAASTGAAAASIQQSATVSAQASASVTASTAATPAATAASAAASAKPTATPSATAAGNTALIVANVSPLDWMAGDCLKDFKDTSTAADVVRCSTPHNAQLVATFYYGVDEAFPGVAELKAKAAQVCKGVQYTSEAAALTTLKQTTAYPTETTWTEKDDRRVDCMVHDSRGGNKLDTTLTQ